MNFNERKLYFFDCECGRKAQTVHKYKAVAGKCAVCLRKSKVLDGQESLFLVTPPEVIAEQLGKDLGKDWDNNIRKGLIYDQIRN